jgi:hypothetical protein
MHACNRACWTVYMHVLLGVPRHTVSIKSDPNFATGAPGPSAIICGLGSVFQSFAKSTTSSNDTQTRPVRPSYLEDSAAYMCIVLVEEMDLA